MVVSIWQCFLAYLQTGVHRAVLNSMLFNFVFHFYLRILQDDFMDMNSLPEMRIMIPDVY